MESNTRVKKKFSQHSKPVLVDIEIDITADQETAVDLAECLEEATQKAYQEWRAEQTE